ncbi:MAG TPA: hypothetical protein VF468_15930 [Actinomycetota bacterium]|nr:hypothetical protein [Actinomycetota bacterium]
MTGRVTARVTSRPAAQQATVKSHNDQASRTLVLACILTTLLSGHRAQGYQ